MSISNSSSTCSSQHLSKHFFLIWSPFLPSPQSYLLVSLYQLLLYLCQHLISAFLHQFALIIRSHSHYQSTHLAALQKPCLHYYVLMSGSSSSFLLWTPLIFQPTISQKALPRIARWRTHTSPPTETHKDCLGLPYGRGIILSLEPCLKLT